MRTSRLISVAAVAAALAAALAITLSDPNPGTAASTLTTASTASTVTQSPYSPPGLAGRPPAVAAVQAPPAPSNSAVFAAVSRAFRTMTSTKYQHQDLENGSAGTYDFDCVGLADYFLSLGAPKALAALRTTEHIPAGYVPSPDHFADYLQALPASAKSLWRLVTHVRQILPGDLIIMQKMTAPGSNFVGHAMIAASAPLLLANGSYALNVFDSTGSPHGPDDSRLWDTRTTPDKTGASNGSGLGFGTIQLWVNQTGTPERISWAIGTSPVRTPIKIARALH